MNIETAKVLDPSGGFNRSILSEYNPCIGLENYIHYFELKDLIDKLVAAQRHTAHLEEQLNATNQVIHSTQCTPSLSSVPPVDLTDGNGCFLGSPDGFVLPSATHVGASSSVKQSPSTTRPIVGSTHVLRKPEHHHIGTGEPPCAVLRDVGTSGVGSATMSGSVASPAAYRETPRAHLLPELRTPALFGKVVIPDEREVDASRMEERRLVEKFFEKLKISYFMVKSFLRTCEIELVERERALVAAGESALREDGAVHNTIPLLYSQLVSLNRYRSINLLGFARVLSLFISRCSTRDLSLQEKVRAADKIISQGHLSKPELDADLLLDRVISVYGLIKNCSFETAKNRLDLFIERDPCLCERILPVSACYHYFTSSAHSRAKGDFSLRIVEGQTSVKLARRMGQLLLCDRVATESGILRNGCVSVSLQESVRGEDVFVVQSMVSAKASMSTSIMELLLTIQGLSLGSAGRITAVIPYMAYCRSTSQIAALAEMIVTSGCHQVITVDLLRGQVGGMFGNVPEHNIDPSIEFVNYITTRSKKEERDLTNLVVVSPDGDTVGRARVFADRLSARINERVFGAKRNPRGVEDVPSPALAARAFGNGVTTSPGASPVRSKAPTQTGKDAGLCEGESGSIDAGAATPTKKCASPPSTAEASTKTQHHQGMAESTANRVFIPVATAMKHPEREERAIDIVGDVEGKSCIIVDSLIDEAVNAYMVAKELKAKGATRVTVVATHALFSGKALDLITETDVFDEIIVSDSIDNEHCFRNPIVAKKLRVISIAPLLAQAIRIVHRDNCM